MGPGPDPTYHCDADPDSDPNPTPILKSPEMFFDVFPAVTLFYLSRQVS